MHSVFSRMFVYTLFAHLFANRNQLDNQDGSSLSPENAARELGLSAEAEPGGMKPKTQRRETDQSSSQECGYAMLTPRTMMVISIEGLIQKHRRLNSKTFLSTLPLLLFLVFQFQLINFLCFVCTAARG